VRPSTVVFPFFAALTLSSFARASVPSDTPPVTVSHAGPPDNDRFGFDERPFSVNVAAGFGTPVGLGGAIVEYSPLPVLGLGVGLGTNLEGPQLTALLRLRPLHWETRNNAFAISLAVAVSEGPYSSNDDLSNATLVDGSSDRYAWLDHAVWLQPDLQFEYASRSGFRLAVSGLGFGFLMNGDSARCRGPVDGSSGCSMGRTIGTFMVEAGYAFP
jgi:hypothetical protein